MTTTLSPSIAAPHVPQAPGAPPAQASPEPRWARPGLCLLLAATALLYLWGLGESGWANGFYSAAVEAGAHSWKAFFFGSFDSSNFITVDKPPGSLWVMELSARIFGVNSWSILVPQALEGVAAVGLLHATIKRRFGPAAGLIAGATLATTPVAALMFRFNNPDALLVLLLVGAAYALTRAVEAGRLRWLVLTGALIGFGFLAKMMQAFLVVPGFALVYLVAAPITLRRRVTHLLLAGAAMVAAAGWWVLAVTLTPAADRPYIGGSQHNSILELILGYNGFGRLTGNETGSVTGGGTTGGAGMWGATGITRLFGSEMGTQIAWLIPAALVGLGAALWFSRRASRLDGQRAGALLWGSWLLVTGLTLSFAAGIIHPYYTVALAPAIGALVGIGVTTLWQHRDEIGTRIAMAVTLVASAFWADELLGRASTWNSWLRPVVLGAAVLAAVIVLAAPFLRRWTSRPRAVLVAGAVAAAVAGLGAPTAYAVQTAATTHSGSLPTAGPTSTGGRGFPGGQGGMPGGGARSQGGMPGGTGGFARGFGGPPTGTAATQGRPAVGTGFGGGTGRTGGGLGGLLDTSTPSAALVTLLQADAAKYTWVAAAVGANSAAGVQLATGHAVMAIGGFNGTDPTPTVSAFEALVHAGKVHYFLASASSGGPSAGGTSTSVASQISSWVAAHYTAKTVGGVTVYDLTTATS
jgi:4-amino-4-deoxy-L-arabinose transferase-like glycosyltransferase